METFSNKQNLREFTAGRHLKEAPKCMYFRTSGRRKMLTRKKIQVAGSNAEQGKC